VTRERDVTIRCRLCKQDMSTPPHGGVAGCPNCGQGLTLRQTQRIFARLFRTSCLYLTRVKTEKVTP